jgi:prepilin-type N-terminal cleavage/methylation domain-containing protein
VSRRSRSGAPAAAAAGVSLIEVVVALAILSVVLLALSGIMWQMGRHTRVSGLMGSRSAALESAASLAQSVRWDRRASVRGCAPDSSGALVFTRCFEVQTIAPSLVQVRVIVTPTVATALKAETLTVQRTRSTALSPLNVP